MKALLIIDMQKGSFRPYSIRYDTMGVIERINSLSAHFRAHRDLVIFIQHDGTKENCFLPGTGDWELLPELTKDPADIVVPKTANDSFYKTELRDLLTTNSITELFVTGCATDFCVDATIKSAISKEYEVTVAEDAHTAADRPQLTAKTVIDYHNWLWADMTPVRSKIRVLKTKDLVNTR
ncbi:MAG: cysteine hydrolase [Bacteroidetes bacterium]|jgi:nicotinamidase-related amidase|nr:cysteine hydrolase [Bacteroidota bacterium]